MRYLPLALFAVGSIIAAIVIWQTVREARPSLLALNSADKGMHVTCKARSGSKQASKPVLAAPLQLGAVSGKAASPCAFTTPMPKRPRGSASGA